MSAPSPPIPPNASADELRAIADDLDAQAKERAAELEAAGRSADAEEKQCRDLDVACRELRANPGVRPWQGSGKWKVLFACFIVALIAFIGYGTTQPSPGEAWPCVGSAVHSAGNGPSLGAECSLRVSRGDGGCRVRVECLDWVHEDTYPCETEEHRRSGSEGQVYIDYSLVIDGLSQSGAELYYHEGQRSLRWTSAPSSRRLNAGLATEGVLSANEESSTIIIVHSCRPLGGSFAHALGSSSGEEGRGLGQEGRGL